VSLIYIVTTIAGFSDFLIPLLCFYGKQYLYAVGGFAHLIQAIAVFCVVVRNYGHITFDFITWVTTWMCVPFCSVMFYSTDRLRSA
jgi:hypothetical protein